MKDTPRIQCKARFLVFALIAILISGLGFIVIPSWNVQAAPKILYVAEDGDDANDCSSIEYRCLSIQRAIDLSSDGDIIKVSGGTYTDVDTASVGYVVNISNDIALYGGYTPAFTEPPDPIANPTTIDAEGNGRVVVVNGSGPTIEGFTITGGYGDFSGGGIKVDYGSPTIRKCKIVANHAEGDGGGIFVNGGSAIIQDNWIEDNTATWAAGARIINDVNATLERNVIVNNIAQISGGGIEVDCCGGTIPLISQNILVDNDGGSSGGGMKINSTNAQLVNNILATNKADHGSGIHLDGAASYPVVADLTHNTLFGDLVEGEGIWIGSYVTSTLTNTIVTNHSTGIVNSDPSSSTVSADFTLYYGNPIDYGSDVVSTHELMGDPAFFDSTTDDFHIRSWSAARDSGVDVGVTEDIDDELRDDGTPDIGADEFHQRTPTFSDVDSNYWAFQWIEALYDTGITSGCSTSPMLYCPDNQVTRSQMAVFLERGMRGSGYNPPSASGTVFDDVPASHWAAAWIEQLSSDGITGGCSANPPLYCPDSTVTRAQMAVFLERANHWPSPFTPPPATDMMFDDVPISHWAAAWIEQLANDGITGGCSTSPPLYCPENPVTRAQMAVFLVRTFNLPMP